MGQSISWSSGVTWDGEHVKRNTAGIDGDWLEKSLG